MHGLVARVGGRLCVVRVVSVVRIAYLGPEGTFTEAALVRMVAAGLVPETGPDALQRMPVESAPAALAAVRDGGADYACVPIENSIDGSVLPTLDSLAIGVRLQVFAETTLDVTFSIVVKPGRNAADVRTLAATVDAATLQHFGSVHEVVSRDQLDEAALRVARDIAAKDTRVIRAAKEALNFIDVQRVNASYRMEQGFTFELNLAGVADEHRDAFVKKS